MQFTELISESTKLMKCFHCVCKNLNTSNPAADGIANTQIPIWINCLVYQSALSASVMKCTLHDNHTVSEQRISRRNPQKLCRKSETVQLPKPVQHDTPSNQLWCFLCLLNEYKSMGIESLR